MDRDKELREVGLRVTVPRLKILRVLEAGARRHFCAEDIYRALLDEGEEINLATVYRVLTQFEAAGLVTRHKFAGTHSSFEIDSGQHHDHIVCVRCGRVDEFVDKTIEARQEEIARRIGYEITDHALYLYGICAKCRVEGEQERIETAPG